MKSIIIYFEGPGDVYGMKALLQNLMSDAGSPEAEIPRENIPAQTEVLVLEPSC